MMTSFKTAIMLSSLSLTTLLMQGCGSSDTETLVAELSSAEQTKKAVTLNFEAVVADEKFECSDTVGAAKLYTNVGSTAESISMRDFRMYISEIYLIKNDGSKELIKLTSNAYQYQSQGSDHTALLDFEDGSGNCKDRGNTATTNSTIVGTVSNAEYRGVEFTLGVPFEINHKEYPEIEALNHPKMTWNWAAGRKFTKLEAQPESNSSLVWNFHVGSTGCQDSDSDGITDSCAQPNRVKVRFDNFDFEKNIIKVDYAALMQNSDLGTNLGGATGCMSALDDPECKESFAGLGLSVEAKNGLCTSGNDCNIDQRLFSVK